MITYAEALRRLMEKAVPVEGMETVPLLYSTHRVLAEDIVSPIAVPGWDNSQMDGYAVRAAELAEASEDHPGRAARFRPHSRPVRLAQGLRRAASRASSRARRCPRVPTRSCPRKTSR